ncbi:ferritin-like domain-containing protein [Paenibacillus sp. MER 99-2]|uniref:ferritin-like domain-containing protein n=1 Tax=Paenibacillus sp. MER 99-2 TaxID=2939572 RepID=UPI002040318C|nr:ferritin-like domain-containing protein [Paenibacillus sp. MER 99-2]MCM3172234.1 ferritin-like domain-containing protein [Paenibacillus sp. MER 99-2]
MYTAYPVHYYYRQGFTPIWATSANEALALMKMAVQGEKSDELFYDALIKLAPNANQAMIITSIRNDERAHNQMFREMYKDLTGQDIGQESQATAEPVDSYLSGLQTAFQGELSAVERYRKIWFGLPYGIYKDTVWGIILDEQKHADKYNNLITYNLPR